ALVTMSCFGAAGCYTASSAGIRDSISNQIDQARIGRHEIDIDARHGAVSLSGTVASNEARRIVEDIATNTPGVRSVDSSLVVSPSSSTAPAGNDRLARNVWENITAH